ncbi:ELF5 factor, partial [Chloroceryle aenea]|nr:ELF5 factor [Chloroceryle aenea]
IKVMLESVTESTFLSNSLVCDPLMSWTELCGTTEDDYTTCDPQTEFSIAKHAVCLHMQNWAYGNPMLYQAMHCCRMAKRQGSCTFKRKALNSTKPRNLQAVHHIGVHFINTHHAPNSTCLQNTNILNRALTKIPILLCWAHSINSPECHSHGRSNKDLQNSHLWEFLRDLLLSPEENDGILEWEDREQGIFRVVKSEALAKMWGQRKKNDRMTYEKLSRALHYYYKSGILERVDRRLVYKFGKNAHGWQENKI